MLREGEILIRSEQFVVLLPLSFYYAVIFLLLKFHPMNGLRVNILPGQIRYC